MKSIVKFFYLASMRYLPVLLLDLMLICCRSEEKKINENIDDAPLAFSDTLLIWDINADSMIMTRDASVPDSATTINRIINGLNAKYPEVQVELLKQSRDTVYTRVPNGEYLGNQMGSAGAAAWFADAVINLTSVRGVNYVSFSMDTFSHAGSTVISRENYAAWRKQ